MASETSSYDAAPQPSRPVKRPGSAGAAFAYRDFRIVWFGSFASNVGTWMQTAVQGAYAYKLTHSSTFVGALGLAQLGPLLLLAMVGGVIADRIDRRRWIMWMQSEQAVFSLVLAWIVIANDHPSRLALFLCVLAVGIGNALSGPAYSSSLPLLVGTRDLPGALSLNSTLINGTRVFGPVLGTLLYRGVGAGAVFAVNAVTYLFVIVAIGMVRIPRTAPVLGTLKERYLGGIHAARRDPVVSRSLVILPLFSFFCLPFISLFAPLAEKSLGLNSKGTGYGLLYAAFGLGAAVGSLSIGTWLTGVDRRLIVRYGLAAFGVLAFVFGLLHHPAPAYPVVFVLGAAYFGLTTALMTIVQSRLADNVRGRVMALWFMGFGGTVSVSGLAFGPVLDHFGGTTMMAVSAVSALVLAAWFNLVKLDERATERAKASAVAGPTAATA